MEPRNTVTPVQQDQDSNGHGGHKTAWALCHPPDRRGTPNASVAGVTHPACSVRIPSAVNQPPY